MSQSIQRHQRSKSDNLQDSQTNKFQSFIHLVHDLSQHDTFNDADKLAKETAAMTAKMQQQGDMIRTLEKDLQVEKKTSAEKISDMEKYFANIIFNTHREEISKRDTQVDEVREDLRNARSQMVESLKNAETRIAECKKASAELTQAKGQLETQRRDLEQARKDVQDLLNKVKERDNQLQRHKDKIAQLEGNVKQLDNENEKFKQSQSQLLRLQKFSDVLVDDDLPQLKRTFTSLWNDYYNAVRNAFNPDLSESVLQSPAWKDLTSLDQTTYATPLPRSNSPVAKFMRTMVVLAFISSQLVCKIFTTTHLVEEDAALRANRLTLAMSNPHKEAFLRGMLATLPDDRESQSHISDTVTEVRKVVRDLLSPETADEFFTDLTRITTDAARFGTSLRTRQSCFEIDVEKVPTDTPWIWRSVSLPDADSPTLPERRVSNAEFSANPAELVIFPKLFTVGPGSDTLIVPGKVLQKSAIEAAIQEIAAAPAHIPRTTSTRHARARVASSYGIDQVPARDDAFLDSRNGSKG